MLGIIYLIITHVQSELRSMYRTLMEEDNDFPGYSTDVGYAIANYNSLFSLSVLLFASTYPFQAIMCLLFNHSALFFLTVFLLKALYQYIVNRK